MGGFFSDKSKTSQQNTGDAISNEAWGISKPLYQQTVTGSGNVLTDILANPAYTGQRVANLNPFQTNSAMDFGRFNARTGTMGAMSQFGTGLKNLVQGGEFGQNAADLYNQYFTGDPSQGALKAGADYANNPYVDGLIDASSRDVTRQLFERDLPGLNRNASGTGNLNSTRTGVESAILKRGAGDRLTDLSSNIRSSFFDKGVGQYNTNLANALSTNNQLLQAGNFGLNAMGGSQDFGLKAFTGGQQAGGVFNVQDQNQLDANKAQFDETQANLLNALKTIAGISGVGATFDGGASSQSGTSSYRPSTASTIGSFIKAFSDIRMKENIEMVGKTDAGFNIYEYDYKPEFKDVAGHGRFRGVMAQEIEQRIPEAVSVAPNGYKMVDYSMVR